MHYHLEEEDKTIRLQDEDIYRDTREERTNEALREDRLHKDYFYAEEELVNAQIEDIYEELTKVIQSMESYGWTVDIRYLTNVLRNL